MMYNTDIYKEPFWAENKGFMTGRDPLGIQNSSVSVYGRLLPGMTNLTQRIRYYGIYCWLLKEYDKLTITNTKKTLEHQYNFIRRAELIIAFMMVNKFSNEKSVIGSNHANEHIDKVKTEGQYDIQKGADKFKISLPELYWDFDSGALGQYYAGSLINLNLIETSDKFFHITERGIKLANAFEKNITTQVGEYFINLISKGKLNLVDIEFIKPFGLSQIHTESEEWEFYRDLLFDSDGDKFKTSDGELSSKRKESIELYITYLQSNPLKIKFDEWIYSQVNIDTKENSALFGWYYYYINEAYHFAIETIFWSMLVYLDGKILPINSYISEIRELVINQNGEYVNMEPLEVFEDVILMTDYSNLIEKLNQLEKLTKSEVNYKIAISKAFDLLSIIYLNIDANLKKIQTFENRHYINLQKGKVTEHIKTYITDNFELTYSAYIEKIIKVIINDHISTAYRKMGNGEVSLLKFIIEDNVIGHIQTMEPKHTTPRINTLHSFLRDMNFVDEISQVTNLGIDSLN